MSADLVINAENISKRYEIGKVKAPRVTLREKANEVFSALTRSLSSQTKKENFIWALRNVSFQVQRGEIVGIIGKNGSGKSTLLKILSFITEPTEGYAEIEGRVASLLDVGTGFHPDLSGRENILLNAAILGMKRSEIKQKFDDIVGFSEIGRFIDTPVKHYSSGMYMRLAFAVAAYLDPDVLLVDEVLAVGDAAFQRKCLGKMGEVTRQGRTILFVTHNLGAILRMCDRCIWLDEGYVKQDGPSSAVIQSYMRAGSHDEAVRAWPNEDAPGDQDAVLRRVRMCQPESVPSVSIDMTKEFQIEIETELRTNMPEMAIVLLILNGEGQVILHTSDTVETKISERQTGRWISTCKIPAYSLNSGFYSLTVGAEIPHQKQIFLLENLLTWNVEAISEDGQPALVWKGIIGPGLAKWSTSLSD